MWPHRPLNVEAARAVLGSAFNISLVCLLPLVLLIVFSIIKFPAFLSIFLTAIFSGVLAIYPARSSSVSPATRT